MTKALIIKLDVIIIQMNKVLLNTILITKTIRFTKVINNHLLNNNRYRLGALPKRLPRCCARLQRYRVIPCKSKHFGLARPLLDALLGLGRFNESQIPIANFKNNKYVSLANGSIFALF